MINNRNRYLFSALPGMAILSFLGTYSVLDHPNKETHPVVHEPIIPPTDTTPPTVELPPDNILYIPPITIKAEVVKTHKVATLPPKKEKVFVCGDWRPLIQGSGNVQECEWK